MYFLALEWTRPCSSVLGECSGWLWWHTPVEFAEGSGGRRITSSRTAFYTGQGLR